MNRKQVLAALVIVALVSLLVLPGLVAASGPSSLSLKQTPTPAQGKPLLPTPKPLLKAPTPMPTKPLLSPPAPPVKQPALVPGARPTSK